MNDVVGSHRPLSWAAAAEPAGHVYLAVCLEPVQEPPVTATEVRNLLPGPAVPHCTEPALLRQKSNGLRSKASRPCQLKGTARCAMSMHSQMFAYYQSTILVSVYPPRLQVQPGCHHISHKDRRRVDGHRGTMKWSCCSASAKTTWESQALSAR